MTEVRRVRMRFGDAEFEADVPEDRVQPMYDRFLCTLERSKGTRVRPINGDGKVSLGTAAGASITAPANAAAAASACGTELRIIGSGESVDNGLLRRVFDLREDGGVILKVLPKGAEKGAEALLLILYGYHRLRNEDGVLATQLHRAAARSGISIRWPAYELAPYDRFVHRVGQRKGSTYSLNDDGMAMAQEITTRILGAVLVEGQHPIFE
jgi:hypothetical protein